MEQEIADAPAKRKAELEELRRKREAHDALMTARETDLWKWGDEQVGSLFKSSLRTMNTDDPAQQEKAVAGFNSRLNEIINRLPEKFQEHYIKSAGEDREFQAEEIWQGGLGYFEPDEEEFDLQNFADADGNVLESHIVGSPGWRKAVNNPNVHPTGDVSQTQKTRDLTTEEAAEEVRVNEKVAEDMRATLRGYTETPGAGGISGWITDNVGGFAGALPGQIGETLERGIARLFSGASPEEVSALRAAAESDLPLFLQMITGDTSRYSDRDVELSRGAQKATDPFASPAQIQGAYSNMVRVAYRQSFRSMKLAQQELPFKFDESPEDDDAIKSFISGLRADGVSEPVIKELIIDFESLTTNAWKDRIGLPRDLQ
jgi:hypothetical protein